MKSFNEGGDIIYNREKAVAYSNTWWNQRNPKYPSFANDCTNFISQCLFEGGFTQKFSQYRHEGWWLIPNHSNWSFSWSVAHSLRWYLILSKRGIETNSVDDLSVGDIIFYDFNGDGKFQHSTIIVEKDGETVLVNAHTSDSFRRDYTYTDSTAYTPNIKYSYIKIIN